MTTSSKSESLDHELLAHHEGRIKQLLAQLARAPKTGNRRLILEASLTAAEASRTDILKAIHAKDERAKAKADHVAFEPLFDPTPTETPEWVSAMDEISAKAKRKAGSAETVEPAIAQVPRDKANRVTSAHGSGTIQRQATNRKPAEAKAPGASNLSDANINAMLSRWCHATRGNARALLARHGDHAGHLAALGARQRRALLDEITRDLDNTAPPKPKP